MIHLPAPLEGRLPRPSALAGLYLLAFCARAAFILAEPTTRLVADERVWTALAAELASPERAFSPLAYRRMFHPPLYVYFVAAMSALGGSLAAVKWAQALWGALLAPLVACTGAATRDNRTGLAAGLFAALYPELVWYCAHFWSETLFVVLLWGALARLRSERPLAAAAAGVLWGLASLTRETALLLAPVAAIWLWWPRGRGWRRGASFAGACLLTVLPWTARNWWVSGSFVGVATRGSFNLWLANTESAWGDVYNEYHSVEGGEAAQARYARERAVEAVLSRQPYWLLEKVSGVMPAFWGVNDHLVVHLQRRAYRIPPVATWALALATVLSYLALLVLAVPWLVVAARERFFALLMALLAVYLAMHLVAFGSPRFRLPMLPILFLLAGRTLASGWGAAWRAQGAAARVGTVALALALAVSVGVSAWYSVRRPVLRRAPEVHVGDAGRPGSRTSMSSLRNSKDSVAPRLYTHRQF